MNTVKFKKIETTVSDHVTLPLNVTIYDLHEENGTVAYLRPDAVQEQFKETPVLWRDDKKGIFGISDTVYCITLPIKAIKGINIANIIPGRGLGGSYLDVYYREPDNELRRRTVLFADYRVFNPIRKKIGQLAECEVILEQEIHNC